MSVSSDPHSHLPSPSTPLYTYSPLPARASSFRLVHILPGSWSSPVECELHVAFSDSTSCPSYKTLSYVWGDPEIIRPILVDGRVFDVTLNLYAALRRLRGTSEVKRMWIDALCINQQDNKERTRQVTMMGSTYAQCEEVVIWLGDSDCVSEVVDASVESHPDMEIKDDERTVEDGTALFESNLKQGLYPIQLSVSSQDLAHSTIANAFAVLYTLAKDEHFGNYDLFIDHVSLKRDLTRKYHQSLKALNNIMKRPYWNRVWVIQEGILPPNATVVCGSISVPWDLFVDAGFGYHSHAASCCHMQWSNLKWRTVFVDFSFIIRIVDWARSRRRKGNKVTLYWLLKQYFDRDATDPRDKAYGLLGLVNDWEDETPLVPDYSISSKQLYEDLTMRIVASTKSLEILMGQSLHHTDDEENDEGMSSWVADWGRLPDAREWDWEQGPWTMYEYYAASLKRPVVAEKFPDSMLRVSGVRVDTVVAVGTLMTVRNQTILFVSLEKVLALYNSTSSSSSSDPLTPSSLYLPTSNRDTQNLDEAYYRTLCGDITYRDDADFAHKYQRTQPGDRRGYDLWRGGFTHSDVGQEGDRAAFRIFWKSACEAVRNRRFFVTSKGYLGLGPKGARVGDEVIVLDGARVPFLVRRTHMPDAEIRGGGDVETVVEFDGDYVHVRPTEEMGRASSPDHLPSKRKGAQESKQSRSKLMFDRFQAKLHIRSHSREEGKGSLWAPLNPAQQKSTPSFASSSTKGPVVNVVEENSKMNRSEKVREEKGNYSTYTPLFKLVGDTYVHGIMDGEVYETSLGLFGAKIAFSEEAMVKYMFLT